ncbi:hypothetical protein KM043_013992 [Ampulex compressa]|nr:hypothetical protein KM043_013992 [Ampulex compressa]
MPMSARTAMMASLLNRSRAEGVSKHSLKKDRSSGLPYRRHQLLKTKTVLQSLQRICDSDEKRLEQQKHSFPCRSVQEKSSCEWYVNTIDEERHEENVPLSFRVCNDSETSNQSKNLDKYLKMQSVISMNNSEDINNSKNCSMEQELSACNNGNQEREMANCSGKSKSDSDQSKQSHSALSPNPDQDDGVMQQQQSADFKFCIIKILHKFKQIYSEFELNTQHLKEIYFGDELIDQEKAEDIVFIFKGIIGKLKIELSKQQDYFTSFYDLWCKNFKLSNVGNDSNRKQYSESIKYTRMNDASLNAKQDKCTVQKAKVVDKYNTEAFSTNYQRKTPLHTKITKRNGDIMSAKVRKISKVAERNSLSVSPILGASRYINTTERRFKKRSIKKPLNQTGSVSSENVINRPMTGATEINVNSRSQRFCTEYKEDMRIKRSFKRPDVSTKKPVVIICNNNDEVVDSFTQSLGNNYKVISDSPSSTVIEEKIRDTQLQRVDNVEHISCESLIDMQKEINSNNTATQRDSIIQLSNKTLEGGEDLSTAVYIEKEKEVVESGLEQIMQEQPQTHINNECLDNSETLQNKKVINPVFSCTKDGNTGKAILKKDCLYCHDSDVDSTCSSLMLLNIQKRKGVLQTVNHKHEIMNNEIHALNTNQVASNLDENALSDSASSTDSKFFSGNSMRLVYEEDESDKIVEMKRLQFRKTSNKSEGMSLVECPVSQIISSDEKTVQQHNATEACGMSKKNSDVLTMCDDRKKSNIFTSLNGQLLKLHLNENNSVIHDIKLKMDCRVLIKRLQGQIHHYTRRHLPHISKKYADRKIAKKNEKTPIRHCYIALCRTEA